MEHLRWPASHFVLVFQGIYLWFTCYKIFRYDLWVPSVHRSDCIQGWNWKYWNRCTNISKISRLSFTMNFILLYSFRCSLLNLNEWFISVREYCTIEKRNNQFVESSNQKWNEYLKWADKQMNQLLETRTHLKFYGIHFDQKFISHTHDQSGSHFKF